MNSPFDALVRSDLTSPQTRAIFEARLKSPQRINQQIFGATERSTLSALCERIIPHCKFDLCDRLENWLGSSKSDGWRDDLLPSDQEAWRIGLRSLDAAADRAHKLDFAALQCPQQDELLIQAREKALDLSSRREASPGKLALTHFDAEQMHAWFEDVRGEVTKIYMADPRTMEQIGFAGFADEQGFTQIRLGELEDFER